MTAIPVTDADREAAANALDCDPFTDSTTRRVAQAIARARAEGGLEAVRSIMDNPDHAPTSLAYKLREQGRAEEREAKDAAYAERNKLALLLAVEHKGTIRRATDAEFGWSSVVLIPTLAGQISFHLHDRELPYALSFPIALDLFEYDGHTTEEKWERVRLASGGNPYAAIRARGEAAK